MLCSLTGVDTRDVIPFRLTGDAFKVFAQLPKERRRDNDAIKTALLGAFAPNPTAAYEQFVGRKLQPGESPDVYLAELRRLSSLFGGVSEKTLACAFAAGLPLTVRAYCTEGGDMSLDRLLTKARSVNGDDWEAGASRVAAAVVSEHIQRKRPRTATRTEESFDRPSTVSRRRCWVCGDTAHLAHRCSRRAAGNGSGEDGSAPASSQV